MIGNEEGTGGTSTLNPTCLRPPRKPSRNGSTPPPRRSNPKPLPQKEDPGSNPSGHPHSCRKTHFVPFVGSPSLRATTFVPAAERRCSPSKTQRHCQGPVG